MPNSLPLADGSRAAGDVQAHATGQSLWRNRDYLLLLGGQMVSSIGSAVSQIAFPLLILAVTRSPAEAGIATALRFIPYVLLMLPAGALVDRWDRKRVMVLCDSGRALALGSIPLAALTGHLSILLLYGAALVEGTLYVFFSLGEMAAIPQVVAAKQLATASAQSQMTESIAQVLGPALGGALFSVSAVVPFLGDAISYVCSVLSLLLIRGRFQRERARPATVTLAGLLGEVRVGVGWMWREPVLRALALLTGGMMACSSGYSLILIVRAQRLGASSAAIGLVLAAGGAGGIVGALLAGQLLRRVPVGRLLVGMTWAWALTWPPFVFAPNLPLLALVVALSFIVVPPYFAAQFSYRLRAIPDALQGRASSIFRLIAFGVSQPLSLAATGVLLQVVGPVATVLLLFVPQVALAVLATLDAPLRAARL